MTDHGPQFLIAPEPEPGEEESLVTGPEPSRNRLRRRLGLGAVVLAGALLVARALGTHDGTRTAATAQDTSRPPAHSGSPPDGTSTLSQEQADQERAAQARAGQQQFAAQIAAHCPTATSCAGSNALPEGFLDAVRDDLGTALPSSQLEVTDAAGTTVEYRQLVADGAGGMQITLTVTRTGEIADGSVVGDVNGGKVLLHAVVAGDDGARYRVELALDGPSDEVPPFQVLQALVTDTRLL